MCGPDLSVGHSRSTLPMEETARQIGGENLRGRELLSMVIFVYMYVMLWAVQKSYNTIIQPPMYREMVQFIEL